MAHQRTLIRNAVVALLIAADTAAADRVYATRFDPIRQLPTIAVYSGNEAVDPSSGDTAPRELTRTVDVEIVGYVAHTAAVPVDVAMDNLAQQIEDAMHAVPELGGAAGDSILRSINTEVVEEDGRSSPVVGVVVLTYAVTYRTDAVPPADLVDFLRAKVTYKPPGVADDDAVSDEATVQETPP
jgi:hypothetical protein